jgi:hypothetical protein
LKIRGKKGIAREGATTRKAEGGRIFSHGATENTEGGDRSAVIDRRYSDEAMMSRALLKISAVFFPIHSLIFLRVLRVLRG